MAGELLVALIGLAGTLIGALGYTYKRNADARYLRAQTEYQTKIKQLELGLKDAEIRAEMAKAQDEQLQRMMALLDKELQINRELTRHAEAWAEILRQKELQDERNYGTLRKLGDENTRYLSGQIVESNRAVITAIGEIPARIELLNVEAVTVMAREIGQKVAAEMAGQIMKLLSEWREADDPAKLETPT